MLDYLWADVCVCVCVCVCLYICFVWIIMLVLGGLRPSCFVLAANIRFIGLFYLFSVTMWAPDTRNDSNGDTNAVNNVFLQFTYVFSSLIIYFTTLHSAFICFKLCWVVFSPFGTLSTDRMCHRVDLGQLTQNTKNGGSPVNEQRSKNDIYHFKKKL